MKIKEVSICCLSGFSVFVCLFVMRALCMHLFLLVSSSRRHFTNVFSIEVHLRQKPIQEHTAPSTE